MLARTFHIDNSGFTFIPNPTPDRWEKQSLSLTKIMGSYRDLFGIELLGAPRNAVIVSRIKHHIDRIMENLDEADPIQRLLHLQALHAALDDTDEVLTARPKPTNGSQKDSGIRPDVLKRESTTLETDRQGMRREKVQDVLRSHLQEVLRLLNDRDDRSSDDMSLYVPDLTPGSPGGTQQPNPTSRSHIVGFEDMNEASPDDKQHKFMEVYFEVIRRRVVTHATYSTDRRASMSGGATATGAPPGFGFRRRFTANKSQPTPHHHDDLNTLRPKDVMRNSFDGPAVVSRPNSVVGSVRNVPAVFVMTGAEANNDVSDASMDQSLADEEVSHDDIWCTLVFRMICWLMLHDFNKADVQMNKSELRGSRMTVYIA